MGSFLFPAWEIWCNHTIRKHSLENFPHFLVWLVRIVSRYRLQCPQNFSRQHVIFCHKVRQPATSLASLCELDCWLTICFRRRWGNRKFWSQLELTSLCKNVDISRDWVEPEVAQVFPLCFSPFTWDFKALSPMRSMSITLLQAQHIALCLSPLNSFTQLNFASLNHLRLNTHLPIAHLNCKRREINIHRPKLTQNTSRSRCPLKQKHMAD